MKPRLRALTLFALLLLPFVVRPASRAQASFTSPAPASQPPKPQTVTPICLDRSDIPESEMNWLYMPATAAELRTTEDFAWLSGQLILSGAVDASSCPLGGVWQDGYATACGLQRTKGASTYLQNVYNEEILAAGRETGVPPVMIKQLIRYESQFWPVQFSQYHHGLGHLTPAGAYDALFWNRDLYEATLRLDPGSSNLPASLLALMDAPCATCPYGIDVAKAEQSIRLLAQVLLAYCKQTSRLIFNATTFAPEVVVDYPTVWRVTLLNYNAGAVCAYDAVRVNWRPGSKLNWVGIANRLKNDTCIRGVGYVDTITYPYFEFPLLR